MAGQVFKTATRCLVKEVKTVVRASVALWIFDDTQIINSPVESIKVTCRWPSLRDISFHTRALTRKSKLDEKPWMRNPEQHFPVSLLVKSRQAVDDPLGIWILRGPFAKNCHGQISRDSNMTIGVGSKKHLQQGKTHSKGKLMKLATKYPSCWVIMDSMFSAYNYTSMECAKSTKHVVIQDSSCRAYSHSPAANAVFHRICLKQNGYKYSCLPPRHHKKYNLFSRVQNMQSLIWWRWTKE